MPASRVNARPDARDLSAAHAVAPALQVGHFARHPRASSLPRLERWVTGPGARGGRAGAALSGPGGQSCIHTSPRTGYRVLVPDLYRGKFSLEVAEAKHYMEGLDLMVRRLCARLRDRSSWSQQPPDSATASLPYWQCVTV